MILLCDFCSQPNPTWCFPAKTFADKYLPISESVGDWAACDGCANLINKDARADLAIKTAETGDELLNSMIPLEDRVALAMQLHAQFFKNRTGPPTRIA